MMNLSTRQRALLVEMRVPVWWPEPAQAAPQMLAPPVSQPVVLPSDPQPVVATPVPVSVPPPVVKALPVRQAGPLSWRVEKPQNLYADALASGGCLIVTEAFWSPQTPPSEWLLGPSRSAAGHLLDNLLRAVQWHQSAQVSVLGLRPATGAPVEADAESLGTDLAQVIARLAPKVVLLMGRVAAQQVLQTSEPLGRLRGQVHSCHGGSAVVTLDAPSLLRHPADKARVWTDLGLALPLMSA